MMREPYKRDMKKRMRLGTRSCVECRRRRVRCIFPPLSDVCQQCSAHGTPCKSQQPTLTETTRSQSRKGDEDTDVHQRLNDLERAVSSLCEAMTLKAKSPVSINSEMSTTEAFNVLRSISTPTNAEGSIIGSTTQESQSDADVLVGSSEPSITFNHAPLLNLLKSAGIVQSVSAQATTSSNLLEATKYEHIKTTIKALNALIPRLDDLTLVLETTEVYWPFWDFLPTHDESQIAVSSSTPHRAIFSARTFILESMESRKPASIAKAVVWLALCIQQLPKDFGTQRNSLPAPPKSLLDCYVSGATTLLSLDTDSAATMEGLQCLVLQARLYIDTGRPRKAWLNLRRAMNLAMLRGFHRSGKGTKEQERKLWVHIWQLDRLLSLLLGLPNGLADSQLNPPEEFEGQAATVRLSYRLSIIAGHITERNQKYPDVSYSVTEQIEEEFRQCYEETPSDLWETNLTNGIPIVTRYGQQILIMNYNLLHKTLHLPYMLDSSCQGSSEKSKKICLAASIEMIKCYQSMRNRSDSSLTMCELMDFQVFSAAIVIVTALLSNSSSASETSSTNVEDWELIKDLTKNLKYLSRAMECTVAGQAAKLLEHLSAAYQGRYSGPETYEASIPYFGTVKISRGHREMAQVDYPLSNSANASNYQDTVEFSADAFLSLNQGYISEFMSDAELGIDWTSVLNMDYNI